MSSLSRSSQLANVLEHYLRVHIQNGDEFFKSRYIADELGVSASKIGAAFTKLREDDNGLCIEEWSYTNGTTWRVTFE